MIRRTTDGPTAPRTDDTDRDFGDRPFSKPRHRIIVRYLRRTQTASLDDIAASVAAEIDVPERRLRIELHHVDLPAIADGGPITYDAERHRATVASDR